LGRAWWKHSGIEKQKKLSQLPQIRDTTGRFLPGQSGNPGGRPVGFHNYIQERTGDGSEWNARLTGQVQQRASKICLHWMTVVADGRQGSEQGQPGRSKVHRTRAATGNKCGRLPLSVRLLVQSSHLWPGPLQLLGVSVRSAPDCVFFLAFLPPSRTRVSNIYPGLLFGRQVTVIRFFFVRVI